MGIMVYSLWVTLRTLNLGIMVKGYLKRTLNYRNYGRFLSMGNAGCISSTVRIRIPLLTRETILFTIDPDYGNFKQIP